MRSSRAMVQVIGAPFNSSGVPDGVALAPAALRAAGLMAQLAAAEVRASDDGDVNTGASIPIRDADCGLLAIESLTTTTVNLRDGVAATLRRGRTPVVIGGDCAVLLGALAGAGSAYGQVGLLFVDGHEDAWPTDRSVSGEAADCELGLLLGVGGAAMPAELAATVPRLPGDAVVVLGPRDAAEFGAAGVASVSPLVRSLRDDADTIAHLDAGARAAHEFAANGLPWWLHIDLDVLTTAVLPAVDYQQPGGLDWEQLTSLTTAAVAVGGCVGVTVCIYNPELDPANECGAPIVTFIAAVAAAMQKGGRVSGVTEAGPYRG